MPTIIAYNDPATGVASVVFPAPNAKQSRESDSDFLNRVASRVVPLSSTFITLDSASLPPRNLVDAWRVNSANSRVEVDMAVARNIRMDQIRVIRDAKLRELDIAYLRAAESSDQPAMTAVASLKQQLRDIPQTTDLTQFQTPEELAQYVPPLLQ